MITIPPAALKAFSASIYLFLSLLVSFCIFLCFLSSLFVHPPLLSVILQHVEDDTQSDALILKDWAQVAIACHTSSHNMLHLIEISFCKTSEAEEEAQIWICLGLQITRAWSYLQFPSTPQMCFYYKLWGINDKNKATTMCI